MTEGIIELSQIAYDELIALGHKELELVDGKKIIVFDGVIVAKGILKDGKKEDKVTDSGADKSS